MFIKKTLEYKAMGDPYGAFEMALRPFKEQSTCVVGLSSTYKENLAQDFYFFAKDSNYEIRVTEIENKFFESLKSILGDKPEVKIFINEKWISPKENEVLATCLLEKVKTIFQVNKD